MELCSLEDAFPDIKNNSDKPDKSERSKNDISGPSREERRAQRKKAKKCKGPPLAFLNAQDDVPDPDRPALKRLGEIPAFTAIEDAYRDLSENSFEGFKMPRLPASNATFTDAGLPDYFQGDDDDDHIKGFAQKEGFANALESSDLKTNTSETFDYAPVLANNQKTIPDPELNVNWKPTTSAKSNTAYYKPGSSGHKLESYTDSSKVQPAEERVSTNGMSLKAEHALAEQKRKSEFLPPRAHADPDSMRELMATQMKELERRMGDFESLNKRDTKNEILMFVGTGLFLLVSLDLIVRIGRG